MLINKSKEWAFLKLLFLILALNLNFDSFSNQTFFDDNVCSQKKSDKEKKWCDIKCLIDRDACIVQCFSLNILLLFNFLILVYIFPEIYNAIERKANSPPKIYFFNF